MAVGLSDLCDDLEAETGALVALLGPLDPTGWATPTPAPGWTIHDQVGHLAYFDEACLVAARDPDRFRSERDAAIADVDAFTASIQARFSGLGGADLLAWFGRARQQLVDAFRTLDPSTRLPWYGPDMSVASAVTARLMETWAHGQDVADALGVTRAPTGRLRHVAHLGVRTLPNSFVARGRPVPEVPVRVVLTGPGGERWEWGPDGAADVVRGSAVDFCLVVTQRRHLADTDLTVTGSTAGEWLSIAQAFAGPPGPGRAPGQFARGGSGA